MLMPDSDSNLLEQLSKSFKMIKNAWTKHKTRDKDLTWFGSMA